MRKSKLFLYCITGMLLVSEKSFSAGGTVLVDISSMTAAEIALMRTETLERTKAEIDYCLKNLGKNFNDVDLKQVGDHSDRICVITYGLIGQKYNMYNDAGKAAGYYYLEWRYTRGTSCGMPDDTGKITIDCAGKDKECALPTGEYDSPFYTAVELWREAGQYEKAAKYYQEYFYGWVSRLDGKTYEEKLASLNRLRVSDPDVKESYESMMEQWGEVKLLAKTEKPRALEPAVQNHKWFYSNKTVEILKALDYYEKNKIKFMVEKASKHKSQIVAKKAKEYLDKWDKPAAEDKKETPPVPEKR